MQSRGFEVEERLVRSDYLHQISGDIYGQLDYFHNLRGIQEISERKDMKLAIAKYLELYKRTNYRVRGKPKKEGGKTHLF
jgi:hypothetical protein